MGIEPTGPTVHVGPNGFEDRGHHQVCKHFPLDSVDSVDSVAAGFHCPGFFAEVPSRSLLPGRPGKLSPVQSSCLFNSLLVVAEKPADKIPAFRAANLYVALLIDADYGVPGNSRGG